jgi:hypothetical protein
MLCRACFPVGPGSTASKTPGGVISVACLQMHAWESSIQAFVGSAHRRMDFVIPHLATLIVVMEATEESVH